MKIGIVVGSIREGRRGREVGEWVLAQSSPRADVEYVLRDLKEFDVPLFSGAASPMVGAKRYDDARVQAWSDAIDDCDAYVFVTPEYNHGVPGAFKNAVDSLGPEWTGKPIAFVSYGADGGVRAVEQWRQIVANFHMHGVRSQLVLGLFSDFSADGTMAPMDRRVQEAQAMLTDLERAVARFAVPVG